METRLPGMAHFTKPFARANLPRPGPLEDGRRVIEDQYYLGIEV